jgi:hypothetical protein
MGRFEKLIAVLAVILTISLVLGTLIAYRHLLEPKVTDIIRGAVADRAGVPKETVEIRFLQELEERKSLFKWKYAVGAVAPNYSICFVYDMWTRRMDRIVEQRFVTPDEVRMFNLVKNLNLKWEENFVPFDLEQDNEGRILFKAYLSWAWWWNDWYFGAVVFDPNTGETQMVLVAYTPPVGTK